MVFSNTLPANQLQLWRIKTTHPLTRKVSLSWKKFKHKCSVLRSLNDCRNEIPLDIDFQWEMGKLFRQEKYSFFSYTRSPLVMMTKKSNRLCTHLKKLNQKQFIRKRPCQKYCPTNLPPFLNFGQYHSSFSFRSSFFSVYWSHHLLFLFIHPLRNFPSYQNFTRTVNSNQNIRTRFLELVNTLENFSSLRHWLFHSPRVSYARLCSRFESKF